MVINVQYSGQMQRFCTNNSIRWTLLTPDVSSASKMRKSHLRSTQKDSEISFQCFTSLTFRPQTIAVTQNQTLYKREHRHYMSFVSDLFLFCYERDFRTSLSDDNQADIIEVFIHVNSTSRY